MPPRQEPAHVLLTVAGRIDDVCYQQCKSLALDIARVQMEVEVDLLPMLECDWDVFLEKKKREFGGKAFEHKDSPMIYYNGSNYIGGTDAFTEFAVRMYGVRERGDNTQKYIDRAAKELSQCLRRTKKQYVFMDITIGDDLPERLTIELFTDKCPKTCENFRMLCTGDREESSTGVNLHYKNTPIHRIVPGGWVQGGDIVHGNGDGGCSIYGPTFPDECFSVDHDAAGIVAMASSGVHSNNSQFFISLRPMPNLNGSKVAFGRVVLGLKALRAVGEVKCAAQRPVKGGEVQVVNCGEPPFSVTAVRRDGGLTNSLGLPLDLRSVRTKSAFLDLRRTSTKRRLLRTVFNDFDVSGKGVVNQEALACELNEKGSLASSHLPNHTLELSAALEAFQTREPGCIESEEFMRLGLLVLSVPGGRTTFTTL